jgi:hypothetical protein
MTPKLKLIKTIIKNSLAAGTRKVAKKEIQAYNKTYWKKLGLNWGIAREYYIPEKKVDITKEIKILTQKYKNQYPTECKTPYDINNGLCDNFASDLVEKTGGAMVGVGHSDLLKKTKIDGGKGISWSEPDIPGHVWLFWNGKHYDAEAPLGVKNWKDLPVFKSQVFGVKKKK